MPQMSLTAPDITCDHCIATISKTVDRIEGARFLGGDPETRSFSVEIASGAVLDRVAEALAEEGYPLGDAPSSGAASTASAPREGMTMFAMAGQAPAPADWQPEYRVTKTEAGADVNYACPCSCDAGFALDRSSAEQSPESCCCGRQIVVGRDAERRLRDTLDDPEAYTFDVQALTMPWGQPLEVALAVPRSGAEHGAHAER